MRFISLVRDANTKRRRSSRHSLWLTWALCGLVLGCGTSDTGSTPCNPLAVAPPETIALQTVLGIGVHTDGTIYVLDQTAKADVRVFVSSGSAGASVLERKAVSGSGTGSDVVDGNSVTWTVVTVSDPAAPFMLKVERSGATQRMGVLRGTTAERNFVIGEVGDVLTVRGSDAVAGLTVKDLTSTVFVEYLADLEDGRRLVIVRPEHDWSYLDFRVFLGGFNRLIERRVKSVMRSRDGGTTTITFADGGGDAIAFFPSALTGGTATLQEQGRTLTLTTAAAGTPPPSGSMFLCL